MLLIHDWLLPGLRLDRAGGDWFPVEEMARAGVRPLGQFAQFVSSLGVRVC